MALMGPGQAAMPFHIAVPSPDVIQDLDMLL